jgi:Hemerythrin HHE cation binding domain
MDTDFMAKGPTGREKMLVAAGAAVAGLAAGIAVAASKKVAVRTADALAGDWLDGVTAEHLEIIEAFDLIEAAKSAGPGRRRKLAQRLRTAIEKHAFQEETAVYPAARAAGAEDAVHSLIMRQAEIKYELYLLDRLPPDEPAWCKQVETVRRAAERVIAEEEDVIFPMLREKLDAKGASELTALVYKTGAKLA